MATDEEKNEIVWILLCFEIIILSSSVFSEIIAYAIMICYANSENPPSPLGKAKRR